ncbi:uncharacterized protein LOC132752703 [Ruditapes philippinarum]|uniref:uncharacterized protein LOC132752703 n=1 Tax=Ruditapes philippinarum TaxID=129788 RepID=UPI00295BC333|nr:uncharacterized protein LOC132752703 [Ruditapes philippinarum]
MKVSRVILSVCLLLQAVQIVKGVHDKGTLNGITFECSKGFSFYDGNCYKAIDVPATVADANVVCSGQGSKPYYPRDEIEYHDYVAKLLPKKIWFGLLKESDDEWKILGGDVPLEMIPRWGNRQPDLMGGNATAVDPKNEVMMYDASGLLPFVCKYPACLEGYMRCDAKCIPSQQVCNGLPECVDERDENNCTSRGTWYLTLSETTGTVQTQPMSDFDEQTWVLEAGVGQRIRLYIPQMNLEENVVFLEVWTGSFLFQSSEMLGRFTGSVSSKHLYSTNHYLSIRFYAASDLSRNIGTYSFEWVTEIPSIPAGTKQEMAINDWKNISMPFTNDEYTPINLKLSWQINANEGNVITYYVQVTPKSGYSVDEVKYELNVEGMEDSLSDRHYYTSTTNEVKLMSNYVPVNGHVTLKYKLGCGVAIDDTYGVIVSPHPVPNDLMCIWTLDAGESASQWEMVSQISYIPESGTGFSMNQSNYSIRR